MRLPSLSLALPVVAALALGSTGCIKSTLTNGQISATREASAAFDTIGDYELARSAAQSGLVQFEGMHVLAPDNTDALFMLTKGWVGYGFAFVEDEMEAAEDAGDDDLADYHRKRARMAYDRAVFYGLQLLAHQADGFDAAKKNELTLAKWLSDNFTSNDDAPELFWTGYGWLARVNLMKGDDTEGPASWPISTSASRCSSGPSRSTPRSSTTRASSPSARTTRARRWPRWTRPSRCSTTRSPRRAAPTSWSSSTTRPSTPA